MKALGKGSVASIVQIGLSIVWWVLWFAAGVWALMSLGYAVFMALASFGIIDAPALPSPANESPDGSRIEIQVSGMDPSAFSSLQWTDWQIFLPVLLIGGVGIAGALVIVSRLRRLFDSFTSGEPFRRENAHHLRVIWITMVVIELSRYVLLAIIGLLLGLVGPPDSIETASFSLSSENFSTWMSILILIVLAEVFREGARLKEEQELTI